LTGCGVPSEFVEPLTRNYPVRPAWKLSRAGQAGPADDRLSPPDLRNPREARMIVAPNVGAIYQYLGRERGCERKGGSP
jgi:hypothetical protein